MNKFFNAIPGGDLFWRRLAQVLPVLVFATFVAFSLLKLVPGDIAVTLAGDNATDVRIEEIRKLYGLDRSFLEQYFTWISNAVQGDLSKSLLTGESVSVSIARCLPHTALIVVLAMLFSFIIGAPLGVMAASRQGGWVDSLVMSLASLGVAIPSFWLAMLLISVFALDMAWFPVTGSLVFSSDPLGAIHHATLPALRGSLMELLQSQQVRTLHAKGLSPMRILWKHGMKNVGVNLLTVLTLMANRMLAATVVIEAVFAIPGMGSLIVKAALQRDFPVVQGVVLAMVVIVLLLNLLADLLYGVIDPRVK